MDPNEYWASRVTRKAELVTSAESLRNFRNNELAIGIDDDWGVKEFRDPLYPLPIIYNTLEPLIPKSRKSLMGDSPKGNPPLVEMDGRKVSRSSVIYAYMASTIPCNEIPFKGTIVEIGGGYGGLARAIKQMLPDVWYVQMDFPPVLEIQKYYLEAFEKIRYMPAGMDDLEGKMDLFINVRSLGEMDLDQVSFYIDLIQRRLKVGGIFYCLNRERRVTNLDKYPFDDRWKTLSSKLWQGPVFNEMKELILERT